MEGFHRRQQSECGPSHLQHQDEQQHGGHDSKQLALLGEGVEVCEADLGLLQEELPLLAGCDAAAQVQPANTHGQGQFAQSQEPPCRQQVPVSFSEDAQDSPNQEVHNQAKEDDLEEHK